MCDESRHRSPSLVFQLWFLILGNVMGSRGLSQANQFSWGLKNLAWRMESKIINLSMFTVDYHFAGGTFLPVRKKCCPQRWSWTLAAACSRDWKAIPTWQHLNFCIYAKIDFCINVLHICFWFFSFAYRRPRVFHGNKIAFIGPCAQFIREYGVSQYVWVLV